uniref:Uncharacterized protein n=1 Tax=Avena sativa TaxID=4498 RepID=A0ACD5Y217_AVESA
MPVVLATAATVLLAAAPVDPSPSIGLPGCRTSCGDVEVPYPFGIGAGCYHKGFNLTCHHSNGTSPPRLLLGVDSTLQVTEISMANATVTVIHRGPVEIRASDGHGAFLGSSLDTDGPFALAAGRNELVVAGCNVAATLRDGTSNLTLGSCSAFCPGADWYTGMMPSTGDGKYCSGLDCCQAPLTADLRRTTAAGEILSRVSYDVQLTWFGRNSTADKVLPGIVFVAKEGWFDHNYDVRTDVQEAAGDGRPPPSAFAAMEVPLVLGWEVLRRDDGAATGSRKWSDECPVDAATSICRSKHSVCFAGYKGYLCACDDGYDGTPYLSNGCQDMNECNFQGEDTVCFGHCTNLNGSYECRCPRGSHGDPYIPDGCVKSVNIGLIIGLSVAFGPGLLIMVVGAVLLRSHLRHRRKKLLKRKFFLQNHGQLLEQLVSHRSGIAEKMIIPLEELEKATNNFDEKRKLGDGGHGTVYKGILSDLHVVAIKKSKIMIQREIDEFINEVAILSQINHKNVVKLYGCCLETEVPLLVYEFISNGTLSDHLHQKPPRSIPWEDRLRIASEVGKAISYLHSAVSFPIIHRDIKSPNILLDDALTAKVSDFGTSRYIPIDQTEITATAVQGTIGYLDPMYYYTGQLSESSDVYSFGVLLVELLTRKMPNMYRSSEGEGLVMKFGELLGEGNLVEILDPQVVEEGGTEVEDVAALAASCIKIRGEERPTMRQVEISLEGLRVTKGCVMYDSRAQQMEDYIATGHPSTRSTSSLEVTRCYSQEKEFSLSARYPR